MGMLDHARGVVGRAVQKPSPSAVLQQILNQPVKRGTTQRKDRIEELFESLSAEQASAILKALLDPKSSLASLFETRLSPKGARLLRQQLAEVAGHQTLEANEKVDLSRAVAVPLKRTLCSKQPTIATYPLPSWVSEYKLGEPERCYFSVFLETARIGKVEPQTPATALGSHFFLSYGELYYRVTVTLVSEGGPTRVERVFPKVSAWDQANNALRVSQPMIALRSKSWPRRPYGKGMNHTERPRWWRGYIWVRPATEYRFTVRLEDSQGRLWRPELKWPGTPASGVNKIGWPALMGRFAVSGKRYVDTCYVVDFNTKKGTLTLCSKHPGKTKNVFPSDCTRAGGTLFKVSFRGFAEEPRLNGDYGVTFRDVPGTNVVVPMVDSKNIPDLNPITTPKLYEYFWNYVTPAMQDESYRLALASAFLKWLPAYTGSGTAIPSRLQRYIPKSALTKSAAKPAAAASGAKQTSSKIGTRATAKKAVGASAGTTSRAVKTPGTSARITSKPTPKPAKAAPKKSPKAAKAAKSPAMVVASRSNSTEAILSVLQTEVFWVSKIKRYKVYITKAGQLVGEHRALKAFVRSYKKNKKRIYANWDSHHIIEEVHLKNMDLAKHYPSRKLLPCVLLPSTAHSNRVGSFLRSADKKVKLTTVDLYAVYYAKAYEHIGAYTGLATSKQIAAELSKVVKKMLGYL